MPYGKQYHGVFDWSSGDDSHPPPSELFGGVCLLDGKEVKQVWYVDTEAGIVKTYDVLHDGVVHPGWNYLPKDFPNRDVDCSEGSPLSETLRGKVELYGPSPRVQEQRSLKCHCC